MRFARHQSATGIKAALSLCLTVLLLLEAAMAASEPLHRFFHPDADNPGHECAVTLFAHGHVDASSVAAPVVVPVTGVEISPRIVISCFTAEAIALPPGRGPPRLRPVS